MSEITPNDRTFCLWRTGIFSAIYIVVWDYLLGTSSMFNCVVFRKRCMLFSLPASITSVLSALNLSSLLIPCTLSWQGTWQAERLHCPSLTNISHKAVSTLSWWHCSLHHLPNSPVAYMLQNDTVWQKVLLVDSQCCCLFFQQRRCPKVP